MNQPAFPVQSIYIEDQETNSRGMTLRDYFAAKVLSSVMSATSRHEPKPDDIANACYRLADAMLKAREV